MKILTIGSDRKLFEEGSDVQNRIIEYGTLFDELHIIVFTTRYQKHGVRFKNTKVGDNVWIYPTYSRNKFFYIVDAVHIGKRIFRTMHFRQGHDCISTQDPFEAGLAGWFLKRASHISLQLQIHTDFFSPYFGRESVLNRIRVRIATFLIPRADGIRVVSKRIKESLESRIPPSTPLRQGYAGRARLWRASKNPAVDPASPRLRWASKALAGKQELKIFVLPIFVDVEKIKNAPVTIDMHKKYPGHDFILLMMSRFTKEKNIPTAIRAVGELKKECPTILLIITGNGPEKINIESIIKNQKLQNNVIVEEWTGDIASYYKTADAFLLFSAYEGYGRAIIEATIAGCPVIMTDVGVAGDVICNGENGIIIPVGDTEALKKAILDLYKNRKKGIGMGERAQRDVARHLYASKQEYLQMYKKSLEQCLE